MTERIAILGASRGLGAAFFETGSSQLTAQWLLSARKEDRLRDLAERHAPESTIFCADFSKVEQQDVLIRALNDFNPTRILYFAGGGPYREFHNVQWKDHLWAWEVSFVFAARVVHFALQRPDRLKQVVLIGSAVAESDADPKAASYAAAKHALMGLVRSIRQEKPAVDVRLYSPSYMDTELLPAHAWPRQQGLAANPKDVAADLWSWIFMNDESGFRIYRI